MAIPYSRMLFGVVPWYSALIVLGILAAIYLAGREEKRLGLPTDTAVDVALVAVPCGIVGARLYYVAMSWEVFRADPVSILYVWEGGVAIYGAGIGGARGAWVYARCKKLPFWRLTDMGAPGRRRAQALGRWGNYFNMEAYGPAILDERFQFFPLGVLIPQAGGYVWHMATFFYESMWNVCGVAALWALRKRQKKPGSLFCWYLLIYGSGRFIIEQLREDSLYLAGLRVSQYLSLVLCAVAAGVLLGRAVRGRKRWFGVALACAALWIARWACLDALWVYGALYVAALAGAVWLQREARSPKGAWLLLVVAAIADAAGLVWAAAGGALAPHVHTLLCSASLPIYIAALCLFWPDNNAAA